MKLDQYAASDCYTVLVGIFIIITINIDARFFFVCERNDPGDCCKLRERERVLSSGGPCL